MYNSGRKKISITNHLFDPDRQSLVDPVMLQYREKCDAVVVVGKFATADIMIAQNTKKILN